MTVITVITRFVFSNGGVNSLSSSLGALSNYVKKEACSLGFIFDSELSLDSQVSKAVQSCTVQLRCLNKVRSFLFSADLEKVIRGFYSNIRTKH